RGGGDRGRPRLRRPPRPPRRPHLRPAGRSTARRRRPLCGNRRGRHGRSGGAMRALHAAIAAALLLPAGAARADGAAFLRFGSVWIVDRGYDLFSTVDATPQVLVGGGWGVDERVDLELAWAFAGSSAQSFG